MSSLDARYIAVASVPAQSGCPHRITMARGERLECATCGSRRINGGPWEYLTAYEFEKYTSDWRRYEPA